MQICKVVVHIRYFNVSTIILLATDRAPNAKFDRFHEFLFFQLQATLDDLDKARRNSSPSRGSQQAARSPRNISQAYTSSRDRINQQDKDQLSTVKLPQNVTEQQWLELKQQLTEQESLLTG